MTKYFTVHSIFWFGIYYLIPLCLDAQQWSCRNNEVYLAGQIAPGEISRLEILNTSKRSWGMDTIIEIELPTGFQAEWDISKTQVTIGVKTIKPLLKVENKRKIIITNFPRIRPGKIIRLHNLMLKNFVGSSRYQTFNVRIDGIEGQLVSNLPQLKYWIENPVNNRYLKPIISTYRMFVSLFFNITRTSSIIRLKNTKGYFRIASLPSGLEYNANFITDVEAYLIPKIIIGNDAIQSILNKKTVLDLHFPAEITLNHTELTLMPLKVAKYEYRGKNTIRITIKKNLKSNQELLLSGVSIMGSKEVILPISFRLDWRKAINSKAKQIVFDNTIQIGNPTVEIEKDIELVANTPSVVIPDIIIKEHAVVSSITPRKSIFLLIPNDLEVQWNRDFTAVTFSGSASGKLKKTPKYISKKELEFEVLEHFKPGENVNISNLKMSALKRSNEDIRLKRKALRLPLVIAFGKSEYKAQRTSPQQIKIVEVDMVSLRNQVILPGDLYEEMNPIRISLRSDFPALRRGDQLKLQFSENFNALWDLGISKVVITGRSKNKISNKIDFESGQNMTKLILNVMDDFTGNEEFDIHGLSLMHAGKPSKGKLRLFLNDNLLPLAEDSTDWLVQYPLFYSMDDQIIFDMDNNTKTFSLILDTRQLENYFTDDKFLSIIIPESSPITFNQEKRNLILYGLSKKYLDDRIQYPSEKEARITIKKSIPPRTHIVVNGLEYSRPTGLTVTPDTIFCSLNKITPFPSKTTFEIVSKKSEFKQAEYYHKILISNFTAGDTLFLDLTEQSSVEWDAEYISRYVDFIYAPAGGAINLKSPIFLNDNKTVGFVIDETLDAMDYFRIKGLAVSNRVNADFTYLSLRVNNLIGRSRVFLRYPLNMGKSGKIRPREVPILFKESYVYPTINLLKRHERQDKEILLSSEDRNHLIIPPIEIQNGILSVNDHNIYDEYNSASRKIKSLLIKWESKRDFINLEKANNLADELTKISPNTWLGYYRKAETLKEMGEFLAQSRTNYSKAKTLGYFSSSTYPQLYLDNVDDQAMADIQKSEDLIAHEQFIEAERILKTILDYPIDSLKYIIRGTAYFLLGDIALRLQDCKYADNYFYEVEDFGVTDLIKYDLDQSQDRLKICLASYEKTDIDTYNEYIPVLAPIEESVDDKRNLNVRISTALQYPFPFMIEDRHTTIVTKVRIGEEITLDTEKIYSLNTHPIRSQIISLGISLTMISVLLGVILL